MYDYNKHFNNWLNFDSQAFHVTHTNTCAGLSFPIIRKHALIVGGNYSKICAKNVYSSPFDLQSVHYESKHSYKHFIIAKHYMLNHENNVCSLNMLKVS